ncbi:MAG: Fe-S cluster assembly protein IscX [Chloroflexi bacterium]|nr:Fe-S cluster assembly protein IscX [Chloroflexota bacterium]MCI0579350.1 Fe-S cluster assembly protein IscX [Chloroflexota bacterium]MCI0646017.1 Fe-S cluster assembly protein IscX [Chloroflexota bacterium]MCI0727439.1 Fe-S cluster assembly protein IscX [Chloroflexota bacterium]
MVEDEGPALYWDSPYAIALALMAHHPNLNPEEVGLNELADLVEALPSFMDDPALANERILLDIQIVWYEEMIGL